MLKHLLHQCLQRCDFFNDVYHHLSSCIAASIFNLVVKGLIHKAPKNVNKIV